MNIQIEEQDAALQLLSLSPKFSPISLNGTFLIFFPSFSDDFFFLIRILPNLLQVHHFKYHLLWVLMVVVVATQVRWTDSVQEEVSNLNREKYRESFPSRDNLPRRNAVLLRCFDPFSPTWKPRKSDRRRQVRLEKLREGKNHPRFTTTRHKSIEAIYRTIYRSSTRWLTTRMGTLEFILLKSEQICWNDTTRRGNEDLGRNWSGTTVERN